MAMEGAAELERGTIEVEHLTKIYGASVALSDFSHSFSPGRGPIS